MVMSKKTGSFAGFVRTNTSSVKCVNRANQCIVWHVFRYRDDRNVGAASRKRTAGDGEEPDAVSDATSDIVSPTVTAQAAIAHVNHSTLPSAPRAQQQLLQTSTQTTSPTNPVTMTTTPYFDPVRDLFRT